MEAVSAKLVSGRELLIRGFYRLVALLLGRFGLRLRAQMWTFMEQGITGKFGVFKSSCQHRQLEAVEVSHWRKVIQPKNIFLSDEAEVAPYNLAEALDCLLQC